MQPVPIDPMPSKKCLSKSPNEPFYEFRLDDIVKVRNRPASPCNASAARTRSGACRRCSRKPPQVPADIRAPDFAADRREGAAPITATRST